MSSAFDLLSEIQALKDLADKMQHEKIPLVSDMGLSEEATAFFKQIGCFFQSEVLNAVYYLGGRVSEQYQKHIDEVCEKYKIAKPRTEQRKLYDKRRIQRIKAEIIEQTPQRKHHKKRRRI